ncbi:MAG: ATP-binding protein [Actinobacteria bacterium]|nr:ATP-binding protein [Actinomycetota bacterium]
MQTSRTNRLNADLPLPPSRARRLEFGLDQLHDVRALVAAAAAAAGFPPDRANDLAAAASELAANSILHGGGAGLATVWGAGGALFVEIADAGTIADPEVGRRPPAPTAEHGRGLYIADRLCSEMSIASNRSGTRIRLRMERE